MDSRSVASALTILTSKQFTPSNITYNNTLDAFVLEYFTGSGEITDDDGSTRLLLYTTAAATYSTAHF